jgi:hypothetical protein
MKLGTLAVVAAATGVLGACSPESTWTSEAHQKAQAMLKDPPSARFKGEYIVKGKPDKSGNFQYAVCGVIDGKNGFGGYTGGSRYVLSGFASEGVRGTDGTLNMEDPSDTKPVGLGNDRTVTAFEYIYWNPTCVDAEHPAAHSAKESLF